MLRRTDVSLRIGRLDSITCNVHARISRDCSPVLHGGFIELYTTQEYGLL